MTIGERIKNRRIELGLSVDELSNILGKNRATTYRYESNDIEKLPTTVLEPLSKVLRVSPGYLMGWENDAMQNGISINGTTNATRAEAPKLTERQNRIVLLFEKLTEAQQDNIIGRAEMLAEQNEHSINVYRAAQSKNNHEDEITSITVDRIQRLKDAPESDEDL